MSQLRLVPVSGAPIEVGAPSMVGRDPSCEIVVTDGSVSRRHARLEPRGAGWWVVDQGSANGTFINSVRATEEPLRNGQELRFGALSYRVELASDPEATVATPVYEDESATVVSSAHVPVEPPPLPTMPPPRTVAPPPPRVAAAPPPPPLAAPAARRAAPAGGSPVPQMPAGAPPAKKGRSPLVWVGVGCCGCLLLVVLLIAVIGGGAVMATRPAANAAHSWLSEVRQGQTELADAGLSSEYRGRLSAEDRQAIAGAIQQSKDATFFSRSIDNDKAVLKGVLTGGGAPRPITIHLVKEGGAWKVDDVHLGVE
ncbi:MAG TPA: FHA domain-containing protein [Vicinamibacteria bacterium]|nr:FHA domain-containing protein [Vicinamibacteria bacterium]